MKKWIIIACMLSVALIFMGSGKKERYHEKALPDPKSFNAHFGDMDRNGDELLNWEEFKGHFPQADQRVFQALDLNKDGSVDEDEWHKFKKAHGLKHEEEEGC
jgi:hypothetical protein